MTFESAFRPSRKGSYQLQVRLSGGVEQTASGVSKAASAGGSPGKGKKQEASLLTKFVGVSSGDPSCNFSLEEKLEASAGSGLAATLTAAVDAKNQGKAGKGTKGEPGGLVIEVYDQSSKSKGGGREPPLGFTFFDLSSLLDKNKDHDGAVALTDGIGGIKTIGHLTLSIRAIDAMRGDIGGGGGGPARSDAAPSGGRKGGGKESSQITVQLTDIKLNRGHFKGVSAVRVEIDMPGSQDEGAVRTAKASVSAGRGNLGCAETFDAAPGTPLRKAVDDALATDGAHARV